VRLTQEGTVADNVHVLRLQDRQRPDPYADLQRQRTAMISAWTAWLATRPDSGDVLHEINGTCCAMRSLADLAALAAGRPR